MSSTKQTLGFQTEVKQLLHLMIHSLYSNKEIFLRELVSNASDACDKLRFEAIQNPSLLDAQELHVRVSYDAGQRTITVEDNGIGMSYDEVVQNLGTIARSGTKEFFTQLSGDQQKDAQLIGQFGVGFYSSFIVADQVTVRTLRAGLPTEQGVEWTSQGQGEFTIETITKATRGTQIVLHLREDQDEFLSSWKLKSILQRYSDHISIPVQMPKETHDPETGKTTVTDEWETINQANALWTRNKSEITDEQYKAFYQHITHDYEEPLAWTHNRVEGRSEYTQLLYIPKHPSFDLWDRNQAHGLKLYVKRVFIMDDADQLLPAYLRFVKGIIDSADLPLNISREILQESRDVRAIREGCTKRILSLLEEMAENKPEDYAIFWQQFGKVFKEGLSEDRANQDRIADLVRFASTHTDSPAQTVSLKDYVSRMKDTQSKIYYVVGDNYAAAKSSPQLEIFAKKGIEVLVLSDRVDEWVLAFWTEYQGKPLVSVSKGALDLNELADEQEKQHQEALVEEAKPLLERLQTVLKDKVKEVKVSARLVDSPACVVVEKYDLSPQLAQMLKAAGQDVPEVKPTLEINPEHPLVKKMAQTQDQDFEDWANVLLDQAMLTEGVALKDPAKFVKTLNRLLMVQH